MAQDITLRQLRYFIALTETGHYRKAAERRRRKAGKMGWAGARGRAGTLTEPSYRPLPEEEAPPPPVKEET